MSTTVIICFLSACSTSQYVRKVLALSSQRCLAAASWSAVPAAISCGPRPGAAGFDHGWVGATIANTATETMMPRCPEDPPSQLSANILHVGLE
jgi:hypothetical protein